MADEQGLWTDTNPGPKNADRRQRDSLFVLKNARINAEGVCRIPHLS